MSRNSGKYFDTKLTREYFECFDASIKKYKESADMLHKEDKAFASNRLFNGKMAKELKIYVDSGTGKTLNDVTDMHNIMGEIQQDIMSSFAFMVDSSPNARIEYDTIEAINNDFKGYYDIFVEDAHKTKGIVDELNGEFGQYVHFSQPNSKDGLDAFEFICGGKSASEGYFRTCQNKLVAFDGAMNGMLKAKDILSRKQILSKKLVNTTNTINSYTPIPGVSPDVILQLVKKVFTNNLNQMRGNKAASSDDGAPVWDEDNCYYYTMENGKVLVFHMGEAQCPRWEVGLDYDNDFGYDPSVEATLDDYKNWLYWGTLCAGAEFMNHLPDGVRTYEHYRDGTGEPLEIDYAKAYNEDSGIKANVDRCVAETNKAVQEMIKNGQQPPFSITSEFITSEVYPKTENWQKAIGGHQMWISADVITDENGNTVVETTVHEMDRYNFNKGMSDIATGTPDEDNGRFEQLGWAKSFDTYGEVSFRTELDVDGDISVPEQIDDGGREARTRVDYAERPNDN